MSDLSFKVKNGLTVNGALLVANNGSVGVNTAAPLTSFHVSSNDGIVIPSGATANRPNILSNTGVIRYNTELSAYEVSFNGTWSTIVAANSNNQVFSQVLTPTILFESTANNTLTYSTNVVTFKTGGVVSWAANSSTFSSFGFTANATAIKVGNSTVNSVITSTSLVIANSTASLSITPATAAQIANNSWFLNANGSWGLVLFQPVGANTQLQFNDSGSWGSSAGLTFNKVSNTFSVSNTITAALTSSRIDATGSFANGASGQNIRLLASNGVSGVLSGASFYGTFANNVDTGSRRAADISAGFSTGSWGTEYLAFGVGTGAPNDNANTTTTRLTITPAGLTVNGSVNASGNASFANVTVNVITGNILSSVSTTANSFTGNTVTAANSISAPLGTFTTLNSTALSSNTVGANGLFANTSTINTLNSNTVSTNSVSSNTVSANSITTIGSDSGLANIRVIGGNYGVILRNDGSNMYLMQTASGNSAGIYNSLRPFYWNLSTGVVTIDGSGAGTTFGGSIYPAGQLSFGNNNSSISWPSGVAIYQDTSGNGPGDIVARTFDGSAYHYTIFGKDGTLNVPLNVSVGGGAIINLINIYDNWSVQRIQISGGGTSTYRAAGGGWQHQFLDQGGTARWLMGSSGSEFSFYCAGDLIAGWSDIELKEDIVTVDSNEGLSRTLSYRIVDFGWNEKGRSFNGKNEGQRERGLIAQEVREVNPNAVSKNSVQVDDDGEPYLTINENKIIFDLIGAIQEHQKQIEKLVERIKVLESR